MSRCIFCDIKDNPDNIVVQNELAFAIYDKHPVSKGHILVIPKRHFESFFEATEEEIVSLYQLINECKKIIDEQFKPSGYNVGVNVGYDAGQTVFHLHIHLIPRYKGDTTHPIGSGIRHIKD